MVTLVTDTQSKNTLLIMADPEGPLSWDTFTELVQQTPRSTEGSIGFSGGCMCLKKEMEYAKNRLATSQWGLGWTYGVH